MYRSKSLRCMTKKALGTPQWQVVRSPARNKANVLAPLVKGFGMTRSNSRNQNQGETQ